MTETNVPWKNKRLWLLALPAAAATVISLVALGQTVVGGAGQSQPGDPLYGWRQSALQLELNLAVDPERRAAIEIALSATAPAPPTLAQGPQVPALAPVVTVTGAGAETSGQAAAGPSPVVPTIIVPAAKPTRPPVVASATMAASPTAPPPATQTQVPTQLPPPTAVNSGPSPSNTPRPTNPPPASQSPDPTQTQEPSKTPDPTETAQAEDVRLTGTLESIGGTWVIAGQSVVVNGGTEIRDNPVVGDTVEVRAWRYPDGTWVAYRIKKE